MAKPLSNLNKTNLYQHYNLINVYDGDTLVKSLSMIKPNHLYAEYKHKQDNLEPPAWFKHWCDNEFKPFKNKMEKVIKLNNLKIE